MVRKPSWKCYAQLVAVVLCAAATKLSYSTASVDGLTWILAPTTLLVELITGTGFKFESYAGYISDDHSFLIAAPCSGVNFLITAFLMLSLGRLWRDQTTNLPWGFIPAAALVAYLTTIIANAVRISIALKTRRFSRDLSCLDPEGVHRLEGILVYFGFLLLLFVISERLCSGKTDASGLLRRSFLPLLIYYAIMLGVPLANGAYRRGSDFWEYVIFVLLAPLPLLFPIVMFLHIKNRRSVVNSDL
jgi:exosortase K